MKKNLSIFKLIKYNFKTFVKFELFFKFLLGIILMPFALNTFNFAMKISGYSYLTLENIMDFLLSPFTIFFILFIIIFLTMVTLFDIATLIIIFDASYNEVKIRVRDAMKMSFERCKNIFKLHNISVTFLLVFLIPFFNMGLSSNVISSIKIPEFIMDYIKTNGPLLLIFCLVYLFLSSMLWKWIFSMHYMILENKSFKEAKKFSRNMIRKNKFKDFLKIFITQIMIAIFYIIFVMIGIFAIILFPKIFSNKILSSIITTICWLFIAVSLIIFANISNGISYAIISKLFYKHKIDKNEKIFKLNYKKGLDNKNKNSKMKLALAIVWIITILCGSLLTYQVLSGKANLNIEFIRNMEITAHRGASSKYPENTMSAFVGAKELGADWIELDVQQSKDKQIVVAHDTNLSRVTGTNKDIIDMNYEDIRKLDAGSFFDKKYKNEYIPLLSEVIEFAKKNNIRLNIELKPTGKEVDFEKQVVELIKQYHFEDQCVITSQVYKVLENVKKVDSDIKTVYVMSIAIGNVIELEYADAFSVEASNVNVALVSKIHNEGKELYAWTVNTEESINKMINMNVDNIITDNIELGKELVIKSKTSNVVNEFFKLLDN